MKNIMNVMIVLDEDDKVLGLVMEVKLQVVILLVQEMLVPGKKSLEEEITENTEMVENQDNNGLPDI